MHQQSAPNLSTLRSALTCNFPQLDAVFEDCMTEALARLSE